uniref:NADH-ubiquinone oxidoreductase chain 3 n=1 Tax=Hydrometra greeni TaxID=1492928 RepID=C5HIP3_9HEMI|nr:NADH dehydrogenase subunit 3 [Hydrometra greeni]ACJ69488.1 NADH dehydrogenase subunit 3 [Hydrometra greeni]
MISMMYSIIMFMCISLVLMFLCSVISKKMNMDREKLTPFECGFDPKSSARIPFSLHFFLIMVIFLMFDIEIVIVIPSIMISQFSNLKMWIILNLIIMMVLMISLYYEWYKNILNWIP